MNAGAPVTLTIADPKAYSLTIHANNEPVLVIRPDGRIEKGAGWKADDEASAAIFDTLSRCAPSWMSALRERAEKAEADAARLKAILKATWPKT